MQVTKQVTTLITKEQLGIVNAKVFGNNCCNHQVKTELALDKCVW